MMRARIAYVDHSYHQKTESTLFLPELLTRHGHRVDIFWDEKWIGGEPVRWETVADHDVVIMFQSYCLEEGRTFRSLHPNVVYIPMFDQFDFFRNPPRNLSDFWEPFQRSKILSFSTPVHTLATSFGIISHLARYVPEIPLTPLRTPEGLHGFFWVRRGEELGWSVIRGLVGTTRFDSFHVHVAGDPGFPPVHPPPPEDLEALHITTSTWFDRRSDFDEIVCRANVYFAPRIAEGIGQTFLEAMARGQCVVAADFPTMNEYIVHAVNGLLYDPRVPTPLDFSQVAHLGREARRGAAAGRRRWERSEETLVNFILTPSPALYDEDVKTPAASRAKASGRGPRSVIPRAVRSLWSAASHRSKESSLT
jgi:glycosyltransferase involved in cell wall biosynthesis